jgi:hypothetical protein
LLSRRRGASLRDKITNDSSITIGDRNTIQGDIAIGDNAKVEKNIIHVDSAKYYKGDRQDITWIEIIAPKVVKKIGLENIRLIGTINFIASILSIIAFFAPMAGASYSSGLLSFTKNYSLLIGAIIVITLMGSTVFLGIYHYYRDTKCKQCGSEFAYKEATDPDVKEIDTAEGVRIYTTRTYQCRKCGDIKILELKRTIEKGKK